MHDIPAARIARIAGAAAHPHDNGDWRPDKQPTIRDVAKVAGVSHMTVSRVINGDSGVRPQTRERVELAIRQLRFTPSPFARALSSAEPARVALLHRFPNPGTLGEYIVRLLQASTRAHATLTIHEVVRAEDDAQAVKDLLSQGVRGVILAPPLGDDRTLVRLVRQAGMAMVATGATGAWSKLPTVGIDERSAARSATEHLLALGHRRIGFITGRANHASSALRLEGFRQALTDAGQACDDAWIEPGLFTYQSGIAAAERLLSLSASLTAIFASNDDMAAGAIAAAHRRGIDVPRDLSVCGFDDSPLATAIWPELTTIRQPTAEMTQRAFAMILEEIGRADRSVQPRSEQLSHLLVCRGSSAAPPSVEGSNRSRCRCSRELPTTSRST